MHDTAERAEARRLEDGIWAVCKLAAQAGDMTYHHHSPHAVQTVLNDVAATTRTLPVHARLLATQDAAHIYSTHALHRTRGEQTTFTICHICGDGVGD
jgi:hypothetical protein